MNNFEKATLAMEIIRREDPQRKTDEAVKKTKRDILEKATLAMEILQREDPQRKVDEEVRKAKLDINLSAIQEMNEMRRCT